MDQLPNIACFQKSIYDAGFIIINSLSCRLMNLMNESIQFQVGIRRYLNTHNFWRVNEFLMLKSVCIYVRTYVFMYVLCMYVCMYYVCMYVCIMYICIHACIHFGYLPLGLY